MSYCRWSEGDIYMFPDVQGGIRCMYCPLLTDKEDAILNSVEEAIVHLKQHTAAGHIFPYHAMARLEEELAAGWIIEPREKKE